MRGSSVSVVVPLYREGRAGADAGRRLLAEPGWREVILAAAGDDAATLDPLRELEREAAGDPAIGRRLRLVFCPARGRARQMNAGAARAGGEVLLFLHADTVLPAGAPVRILKALAGGARWGRFDVRLDGEGILFRVIEVMMNLRSRITGIATGDQGIFLERALFDSLGGYADIDLMEDIELSRRLKRAVGPPAAVSQPVVTSARRWRQGGVLRTILLMWRLRLLYWLGTDPAELARQYRDAR